LFFCHELPVTWRWAILQALCYGRYFRELLQKLVAERLKVHATPL